MFDFFLKNNCSEIQALNTHIIKDHSKFTQCCNGAMCINPKAKPNTNISV